MLNFEELDDTTRRFMLEEFLTEERGQPYRSPLLSLAGLQVFPKLMEDAIRHGNEETLARALAIPAYWVPSTTAQRRARVITQRVNPAAAAERLAITEFNTWYVRGLARRLLEEGVESCQVYRAQHTWQPRAECMLHEGKVYPVRLIYEAHRARYWPAPGNPNAISIPVGPNCHHTIRRYLGK